MGAAGVPLDLGRAAPILKKYDVEGRRKGEEVELEVEVEVEVEVEIEVEVEVEVAVEVEVEVEVKAEVDVEVEVEVEVGGRVVVGKGVKGSQRQGYL